MSRAMPVQVLCFPHAGGSEAVFRGWNAHAPEWLELKPVHLPGRLDRVGTPMPRDLDSLIDYILEQGVVPIGRPFALLGISMGALVAFELARTLARTGSDAGLRHIFPVSYASPREGYHYNLHVLPDEEFIDALRFIDATPPAVLGSAEMMEMMLPTLRADFGLAERYRYTSAPPLRVSCSVVHGDADPGCSPGEADAWRHEVSGDFTVHTLAGGHFFFRPEPAELVGIVAHALERGCRTSRPA